MPTSAVTFGGILVPCTAFGYNGGMKTATTSLDAARHRLLEGVLLRLARLPDAGGLVLRGGMLLRHWFRPTPRRAMDLDLVAPAPLTPDDADRYLPLFHDNVADGVTFDGDALDVEGIWGHTDNPGLRLHVAGSFAGVASDFHIDITGGPAPRPAAVFGELPTAFGQPARLWLCRPESVAGQKLQALWHMGLHRWRPKDLDDLRILLQRLPLDQAAFHEAIAALFTDLGGSGADARAVFGPAAWWGMKIATARWTDYVTSPRGRAAPTDLAAVVAEVAGRLIPMLEGVP